MKIGFVGLGKMGGGMVRRLVRGGHEVVSFDADAARLADAVGAGAKPAAGLVELTGTLEPPRIVWLMLPAGHVTGDAIDGIAAACAAGDIIVDGGNSNYRDTMARAERLAERDVELIDIGVSGGLRGELDGYALMAGCSERAFELVSPLLRTLAPAPDRGWSRVGPVGAGHYVKMIHNGIEYGMMQAFAEGFELLAAKEEFDVDLAAVAELWRHGSVVRSWLLDLVAEALARDPELRDMAERVGDSGEGRWTAIESIDLGVPAPVITAALQMRFRSQQSSSLAARLLSAMRHGFGGHAGAGGGRDT
jgi:6-phosphogluconate dehydrogenase